MHVPLSIPTKNNKNKKQRPDARAKRHEKKQNYYSGNYDQFVQTRAELEENQMKKYRWEQEQIAGMKEYIAKFGHGSAKLARQAQSKEKVLAKMVRGGLTERVEGDRTVKLSFTDVGKLPPPVLQFADVAFGYSRDKILYANVDLGVDLDSRVAIVGPNGTGTFFFFFFFFSFSSFSRRRRPLFGRAFCLLASVSCSFSSFVYRGVSEVALSQRPSVSPSTHTSNNGLTTKKFPPTKETKKKPTKNTKKTQKKYSQASPRCST